MSVFHVNGPAGLVYGGALLGYGVDGADIEFSIAHHPVMCDPAGGSGGKPGDVQFMNMDAIVSSQLAAFDWAVLKSAIANACASSNAGTMGPSGMLLGANGFLRSLTIPSSLDGQPHNFQTCYLMAPTRMPLGTVNTTVNVVFHAFAYIGPLVDSLAGKVLYSNT